MEGEDGSNFQSVPLRSAQNNYSGKSTVNHKIVLLGDMGVGKTCLSIRYYLLIPDIFIDMHMASSQARTKRQSVDAS
jgi:hypothetical protein